MNHLVIYSHPNPKSFGHAILETVVETAKAKGHEVTVRDLYALGFDPVLKASDLAGFKAGKIAADILAEQDFVAAAGVLTIIHPIWWTGLPAIVKGYFDRVFSFGFAYSYGDGGPIGLLRAKRAVIFNTTGTPDAVYGPSGMHEALRHTSDKGIYEFCGLEIVAHKFFGGVPSVDNATRQGYLAEVRTVVRAL
jgi:NAD(P)H dehydrogenase (quinone)